MTKRIAANGAPLDTLKRITGEFHAICGISDNGPPTQNETSLLNTGLGNDVQEFSETLRSALIKHMDGADDAVATFKKALKLRSALLSDPNVRNQECGELDVYLRNIVHKDSDGDPEKSLKLTKELHKNAIDPHYEGIEPPEPQQTKRINKPVIL